MASSLPTLIGRQVVCILAQFGWAVARQAGPYIIMTNAGQVDTLSVPDHREVSKGTLRTLIRPAGLTFDEFAAMA